MALAVQTVMWHHFRHKGSPGLGLYVMAAFKSTFTLWKYSDPKGGLIDLLGLPCQEVPAGLHARNGVLVAHYSLPDRLVYF